ncbi:hypothetical protein Tco_1282339 [Tanacetum coccineum]
MLLGFLINIFWALDSNDPIDTPLVEKTKQDADLEGKTIDPTHYHGMIGSLMYLTSSRLDLVFAVCMCARCGSRGCQEQELCTLVSANFRRQNLAAGSKKSQLTDYGFEFNKIPLYYDNKSAIALCCNNVQHSRSKHIDVRYHFIKEQVKNGVVELYFVRTKYQLAEIFTKALPRERYEFLINKIGMKSISLETLKKLAEENEEWWRNLFTPRQGPTQRWLMALASSIDKQLKTFDELMITLIDFSAHIMNGLKITNLTQETLLEPAFKLLKGTRTNYAELEYDFEEFDYFFNNDLKYLQGGISTMTYTTSITKTKAAQYDLLDQRKTFYGYARGLESTHDVYSTKRILAVTRVKVMRKHGYGYLREIEVWRADNDLYTFKEGDFPTLRINDIKDMLIIIIQNKLTNLSGDDVSDFAIALLMFTRSMVIQMRVEDLQLGVESYHKKINVTKPETTRPDIRKKEPYTLYQDP